MNDVKLFGLVPYYAAFREENRSKRMGFTNFLKYDLQQCFSMIIIYLIKI